MIDSIIAGTGNSRYLKSVENFLQKYPTYQSFAQALIAGTLPIDLNGINQEGFSVLGDPLNKATLFKDATADLYGLPSTAVPDDAFNSLSILFLYWWRVQSSDGVSYVSSTNRNAYPDSGTSDYVIVEETTTAYTFTVNVGSTYNYYDSVSAVDGEIVPSGMHSISVSDGNVNTFTGKYVYSNAGSNIGTLVKVGVMLNNVVGQYSSVNVKKLTAVPGPESSSYLFLGKPIENVISLSQTDFGSYIGTGGAGSSQKTSLSFPFNAKILLVSAAENGGSAGMGTAIFLNGAYCGMYLLGSNSKTLPLTVEANVWSWYDAGSNATTQCNALNITYNYAAIG